MRVFRLFWLWPRRWWHWLVLTLLAIILIVAGFLPGLLRREVVAALAKATPATVRLADVDVSLFRGRLALNHLTLTLPGEERAVLSIAQLIGELQPLAWLRGERTIDEVRLSGVQLTVRRSAAGHLNLTRLLPPPPPEPVPPADLPNLLVKRLQLSDLTIEYRDASSPESRATLVLDNLTTGAIPLQAQGFAAPVPIQLQGELNMARVAGEGRVFWTRAETSIDTTVTVQHLPLAHLAPYLRGTLTVEKLAGEADARLHYILRSGGKPPPAHMLDGTVTIADLSFVEPSSQQVPLHLPQGQIVIDHVDLLRRQLQLSSVILRDPQVAALQTPAGLNWAKLVPPSQLSSPPQQPVAKEGPTWQVMVQSVKTEGGTIVYRDHTWAETETLTFLPEEIELRNIKSTGDTEIPLHFRLRVGEGKLTGDGGLQLSPLRFQTQVEITNLTLPSFAPLLTRLASWKRAEGQLSGSMRLDVAMVDDAPMVKLAGTLDTLTFLVDGLPAPENVTTWVSGRIVFREESSVMPLNLATDVTLSQATLQRLPLGDLSMESLTGSLRVSRQRIATEPAASSPAESSPESMKSAVVDAQGTLEVKSVLLAHGAEKQELLSCNGLKVRLKEGSRLLPLDLHFTEVALEYPYAQGFRTDTGQFQLATPVASVVAAPPVSEHAKEETPPRETLASDAENKALPPAFHFDRLTLLGGQLYFEDHAVAPSQTIYWQDIRMELSEVGYPLVRPATFLLHAFNMDGAPIEVNGRTEHQGGQLLTRMNGAIDHMTLSRFNAYLAPVLGYKVRKGAVSVKWELLMPGELVKATAAVTLHDIGLSGKESTSELETQIGLPMTLIIALLKDLNGNINLQLPMEGRVNEPGFRLGGTIWRAIRDVLIGAVTSPLKLLGAVFSGKDTLEDFSLEPIPFIPGTSQLSPTGKAQLQRLRAFLAQRPELDLQLSSAAGSEDQQMLKDRLLATQLEPTNQPAQTEAGAPPNAEQSTAQTEPAPPLTPEKEVWQFLKRRLEQGETQPVVLSGPAAVLLTKLREQTTVAPQALAQLTQERMQTVMSSLTTEKPGVAADRLHVSTEKKRGRGAAEVQYMIQAREKR